MKTDILNMTCHGQSWKADERPAPNKAQPRKQDAASHSPLPWHIAEYGIAELKAKYLCIKNGSKTIAKIDASGNSLSVTKADEANAKLIVASVNHADKLAEALREIAADAQEANEKRNTAEWDFRCTHIEATAMATLAAYEAAQ